MTEWSEEDARAIVSLFQGLHQDKVIAAAEESMASIPEVDAQPMPNTAHPAFSHSAELCRSMDRHHFVIAMVKQRGSFVMEEEDLSAPTPVSKVVLARRKMVGLAPFVGDPRVNEAAYMWSVWSDDYGRYIAGEAKLIWRY